VYSYGQDRGCDSSSCTNWTATIGTEIGECNFFRYDGHAEPTWRSDVVGFSTRQATACEMIVRGLQTADPLDVCDD
jgi:hypothetical protein